MENLHLRCTKVFQSTPSAWRETTGYSYNTFSVFLFQSTPSAWRETYHRFYDSDSVEISIHSLRMEGDCLKIAIGVE